MVESIECQEGQQTAERRLAVVDVCQGDYSGPLMYKGRDCTESWPLFVEVLLAFTGMKSEQRFNRIHGLILLGVADGHDLCDVFENMGETRVGSNISVYLKWMGTMPSCCVFLCRLESALKSRTLYLVQK